MVIKSNIKVVTSFIDNIICRVEKSYEELPPVLHILKYDELSLDKGDYKVTVCRGATIMKDVDISYIVINNKLESDIHVYISNRKINGKNTYIVNISGYKSSDGFVTIQSGKGTALNIYTSEEVLQEVLSLKFKNTHYNF